MKHLTTYKLFENNNNSIEMELFDHIKNELLPKVSKILGYDIEIYSRTTIPSRIYYIKLDLPQEKLDYLNKNIFNKYDLFNEIRKEIPFFNIDNFFNKKNPYEIRVDLYLHESKLQEYVLKHLPHLITKFDERNLLSYGIKKEPDVIDILDSKELGLLEKLNSLKNISWDTNIINKYINNEMIDERLNILSKQSINTYIGRGNNYYAIFRECIIPDDIIKKILNDLDINTALMIAEIRLTIYEKFNIKRKIQDTLIRVFNDDIEFYNEIRYKIYDPYIESKMKWVDDSEELGLL